MGNITRIAHNRVDHTGKKFGRLTVMSYAHTLKKRSWWNCVCECGGTKIANGHELVRGDTKSCGCIRGVANTRHGESKGKKTKEYRTWKGIRTRCQNTNHHKYPIYGGRGIKLCDRWSLYENFLADMGRAPGPDYSIERDEVNGNYEPGNCRWATATEQMNNTRRNVFYTVNGERKTLTQWCRELGLKYWATRARIANGWTIEEALLLTS